jgi:transposase-like protein
MNLFDVAKRVASEDEAREVFEKVRWLDGVICPKCGVAGKSYRLHGKPCSKHPVRAGMWKCGACRKPFTVTVGTVFEDSHIKLDKWLMAIHLIASSKKGMSAHQLHRMLGVTYKTAWFMAHRIRYAMEQGSFLKPLEGTVEVDETFIGGKFRTGSQAVKPGERPKDHLAGTANKAPVVSLVERGGNVRSFHVANVTATNLKAVIRENIKPTAHVMTDESGVYKFVGKEYAKHSTVNHAAKEYARTDADGTLATTNTVEGFFSLLKRGVYGTFHHISKQHLHRYLSEFDFRYNARENTDGERSLLAIKGSEGKRLMYRQSKRGETNTSVG